MSVVHRVPPPPPPWPPGRQCIFCFSQTFPSQNVSMSGCAGAKFPSIPFQTNNHLSLFRAPIRRDPFVLFSPLPMLCLLNVNDAFSLVRVSSGVPDACVAPIRQNLAFVFMPNFHHFLEKRKQKKRTPKKNSYLLINGLSSFCWWTQNRCGVPHCTDRDLPWRTWYP